MQTHRHTQRIMHSTRYLVLGLRNAALELIITSEYKPSIKSVLSILNSDHPLLTFRLISLYTPNLIIFFSPRPIIYRANLFCLCISHACLFCTLCRINLFTNIKFSPLNMKGLQKVYGKKCVFWKILYMFSEMFTP